MELGTFGAIIKFAMDLEEQGLQFYEGAARGGLRDVFDERARGTRKRLRRLERARREMISEMLLESIVGLEGDAYVVALDDKADEDALSRQAQDFEATCARFYRDAAAKLPIREVVRAFERLARENEQRQHEGG